jgi:hypothetical protein
MRLLNRFARSQFAAPARSSVALLPHPRPAPLGAAPAVRPPESNGRERSEPACERSPSVSSLRSPRSTPATTALDRRSVLAAACSARTFSLPVILLFLALPARAESDYTIQSDRKDPPKELHDSIRKLLDGRCLHLKDKEGEDLIEVWFRREVPVDATEVQVKNGLTYQEVPSSTVLGAIRIVKETTDYRKQKLPAGVYTMRLAIQPISDDHDGTAPHREFCLLCSAKEDKKPDLLAPKALHKLSAKINDEHPSVLLLFPGKGATDTAKLAARPGGHRVLLVQLPAVAGTIKGTILIGLTLVGTSPKAPGRDG